MQTRRPVPDRPRLELANVAKQDLPPSLTPSFMRPTSPPDLAELAASTEASFKGQFRGTPITRAGKQGMLGNVALAAAGG